MSVHAHSAMADGNQATDDLHTDIEVQSVDRWADIPLDVPPPPNWTSLVSTPKKRRPVPPPLSETDLGPGATAPVVPTWTPKVGGNEDAGIPAAPCWTPTISVEAATAPAPATVVAPPSNMEVNVPTVAAPPVPCPPMPMSSSVSPYPQEQYDPYALQQSSVGSCVMPAPAPQVIAWYRVAFAGGIALRSGPCVDSARTGCMLYQNETFAVSETLNGLDGRVYLLLADGRGWVFDDSALMPHDPSVVRGRWQPAPQPAPVMPDPSVAPVAPFPAMPYSAPPAWDQPLCQEAYDEDATKKRRRRKRGGVKRNKNKRANWQEADLAEADTDEPRDASLEGDSQNSEVEAEASA